MDHETSIDQLLSDCGCLFGGIEGLVLVDEPFDEVLSREALCISLHVVLPVADIQATAFDRFLRLFENLREVILVTLFH